MGSLLAQDIISGKEGRAYAIIGDQRQEMFYLKKLESTVEKQKAEIKTLGKRGTQHKASGWSGSGTMTIYYVTSLFRDLMYRYIREGIDTYFDIEVVNEDPASTIGKQTITLIGVNLDKVPMAMLDTESDALEEDIDFTFEDILLGDKFNNPALG